MISKFKKKSIFGLIAALILTTVVSCTGLTNAQNKSNNTNSKTNTSVPSSTNTNKKESNTASNTAVQSASTSNTANVNNNNVNSHSSSSTNKKTTSYDKETSNTNSSAADNNSQNTTISDTELANLLYNGDASVRKIVNIWGREKGYPIPIANSSYMKLKQKCTTYNGLQRYLNSSIGLGNYFSNAFTQRFIGTIFTKYNGEYYCKYGEFQLPLQKGSIKIISKVKNGNSLAVTFTCNYSDGTPKGKDTAELIYSNGHYYISSMNTWRMF